MHAADGGDGAPVQPALGPLRRRRGPRAPLVLAGICMFVSAVVLANISASTPLGLLLGVYAVFGVGFGTVNAPITYTAVSGMPNSQAGVAAAYASTSRQIGQAMGIAITGSIVGVVAAASIGADFVSAARPAWWVIAACALAVLALGLATSGRWARETARRTAERFERESAAEPLITA